MKPENWNDLGYWDRADLKLGEEHIRDLLNGWAELRERVQRTINVYGQVTGQQVGDLEDAEELSIGEYNIQAQWATWWRYERDGGYSIDMPTRYLWEEGWQDKIRAQIEEKKRKEQEEKEAAAAAAAKKRHEEKYAQFIKLKQEFEK